MFSSMVEDRHDTVHRHCRMTGKHLSVFVSPEAGVVRLRRTIQIVTGKSEPAPLGRQALFATADPTASSLADVTITT